MELYGIEYLRSKLVMKRTRTLLRYSYYDMKNITIEKSPVMPDELQSAYKCALGWCGKAVDTMADRLSFIGFDEDTDTFNMNEIFNLNNPDILTDSAILGALICSCNFIYISKDENGFPRLQVIDGSEATGVIDSITGMLKEGYAVLERDKDYNPITEAYFTSESTTIIQKVQRGVVQYTEPNPTLYPLLVPIIFRPDAKRPFGHSRISRACMDIQKQAVKTLMRAGISADFYSFPQKYFLGLSPDAEPMERWRATISTMLQFTKDEDGDHPVVGQFQQASATPHLEQFKMYAAAFAGETGLTLDDMGFMTGNPSSADAIKSQHENLKLKARKAQRNFRTGFLNVGYLAASLRDGQPYERKQIYNTRVLWEPLFEPDASMLSSIGDGAIKLNQAVPNYITDKTLRELTGIKAE